MNTASKKHSNSHDDKRPEPVTSYGVININITEPLSHYTPLILQAFEQSKTEIDITNIVNIDSDEFRLLRDLVSESILFLLISRKHSLGFVEFIRGRYDVNDDESIRHLFIQMTENEIREIFTVNFDMLWNSMWKKNAKKTTYHKEYIYAKDKHSRVIQKYKSNNYSVLISSYILILHENGDFLREEKTIMKQIYHAQLENVAKKLHYSNRKFRFYQAFYH